MNVEIGTEAPIFLFWEYLFQIFGILSLQCRFAPCSFRFIDDLKPLSARHPFDEADDGGKCSMAMWPPIH
jgi:hypothetical protein